MKRRMWSSVATSDAYIANHISYFATFCDIWIGNSDAINYTSIKLRYTQKTNSSEKHINSDDQILQFELKNALMLLKFSTF